MARRGGGDSDRAIRKVFGTALRRALSHGGIRWRTIIGPVHVEYGYNLNPRPQDPVGQVQFSLGFPF